MCRNAILWKQGGKGIVGKEQGILATLDGRIPGYRRMVWTILDIDTGGCDGESKECTTDKGLEGGMEITFGRCSSPYLDGWRFGREILPAQLV